MRKTFTEEERAAYNAQKTAEANGRIEELARTWQDRPEDITEYIRFQSRFYTYSARNKMLIYKQNPYASFVASMADFNKMGYWVRRGQHGMSISVYMPIITFRTKPSAPWRSLRTASDAEKAMIKAGMLETREQARFGTGSVYDISQTNCPLEDYPKLLGMGYNDAQHAAIYDAVKKYCEILGMQVKESGLHSVTTRGLYEHGTRRIYINELLGDTQRLSTLLHEMSHDLVGHNTDTGKSTAQIEFEADALSMMFAQQYGIPVTDTRKSHLAASYSKYCSELRQAEKPVEIDKLFEPVNDAFKRHVERLGQHLETAGILQTPQDITIYSVRTIENGQAVIAEGFRSLEAALGHIRQMAESSETALQNGATVESWKIMPDHTQFEISAGGKSVTQLEYVQGVGLQEAPIHAEMEIGQTSENDHSHEYMLLDRLRTDCEYYLGHGQRSEKYLWAGSVDAQIQKMQELYDQLPQKPKWLTEQDIQNYARQMTEEPIFVNDGQAESAQEFAEPEYEQDEEFEMTMY